MLPAPGIIVAEQARRRHGSKIPHCVLRASRQFSASSIVVLSHGACLRQQITNDYYCDEHEASDLRVTLLLSRIRCPICSRPERVAALQARQHNLATAKEAVVNRHPRFSAWT